MPILSRELRNSFGALLSINLGPYNLGPTILTSHILYGQVSTKLSLQLQASVIGASSQERDCSQLEGLILSRICWQRAQGGSGGLSIQIYIY